MKRSPNRQNRERVSVLCLRRADGRTAVHGETDHRAVRPAGVGSSWLCKPCETLGSEVDLAPETGLEPVSTAFSALLLVAFGGVFMPLLIQYIACVGKDNMALTGKQRQEDLCGIVRLCGICAGVRTSRNLCGICAGDQCAALWLLFPSNFFRRHPSSVSKPLSPSVSLLAGAPFRRHASGPVSV